MAKANKKSTSGKGKDERKARKRAKADKAGSRARGKGKRKRDKKAKAGKRGKPPASGRAARGAALQALARRIVKAASDPEFRLADLYADDCVSVEASGDTARGLAGLEEKMKRWEQMQKGARFEARHVWVGPSTVCIEWDAEVELRDGRTVELHEVAVHEIENGKIVAERYYYNPMALAPQAAAGSSAT